MFEVDESMKLMREVRASSVYPRLWTKRGVDVSTCAVAVGCAAVRLLLSDCRTGLRSCEGGIEIRTRVMQAENRFNGSVKQRIVCFAMWSVCYVWFGRFFNYPSCVCLFRRCPLRPLLILKKTTLAQSSRR